MNSKYLTVFCTASLFLFPLTLYAENTVKIKDASRPAEAGCKWHPFGSEKLGVSLLVENCASPATDYEFTTKGNWVEQHRPSDDRTFNGAHVLQMFSKNEDDSIEKTLEMNFVHTLMDPAARDSCKVKAIPVQNVKKKILRFEIVPTGAYEQQINKQLAQEPRDFGCGEYGKAQEKVYFEYHPDESNSAYAFVIAGMDEHPLFDENSIVFSSN